MANKILVQGGNQAIKWIEITEARENLRKKETTVECTRATEGFRATIGGGKVDDC